MANLFAFVKKYWYVVLPLPLIILYFIVRKLLTGQNVNTVTNTKTTITMPSTNSVLDISLSDANNPMNLRVSSDNWQGKIGIVRTSKSGEFLAFDTLLHGLRAGIVTLHTYYFKHGRKSLNSIIHAFAPSSENDTNGYVNTVSKKTGFQPNETLDFNRSTYDKIIVAMCQQERGFTPTTNQLNDAWETVNFKL